MPHSIPSPPSIEAFAGIDGLTARFDGLLIDIWGVLHDGRQVFPGVLDALTRLGHQSIGRVLLSNSSRPADMLAHMLERFGVLPSHYDAIVSSGEACKVALERMRDPLLAGKPRRALYVGDQHDLEWITPLGLELVADAKEASFVLLTSIDERTDPIGAYLPALTRALDLNLPLLCANPDRSVLIAGELRMGSGTLADLYADLGGTVLWFGKPHPAVYELAVEHLRGLGKTRICALGDALETDIKGALDQGLAAALVPGGGVHRLELGTGFGELPDTEAMEALLARHGVRPDFLLAALR